MAKQIIKNAQIKRKDLIRLLAGRWADITDKTQIYRVTVPTLFIPGGPRINADQQVDIPGEKLDTETGYLMAGYDEKTDSAAVLMPLLPNDDGRLVRLEIVS